MMNANLAGVCMQIQTTGTVHGRMIELDAATELAEGQRVEVTVVPVASGPKTWGEGLRQAAGIMAGVPEFERAMDEVHQLRRSDRPGASFP
jgi:hypothetical protein